MTEFALQRLQWFAQFLRVRRWTLSFGERVTLRPVVFALLLALIVSVAFHGPFLQLVQQKIPGQFGLQALLLLVLWLVNSLLFLLFSPPGLPRTQVVLLSALLLVAAVSHYFVSHFGTVIDRAMLQNVLETDLAEAEGLLSFDLMLTIVGWFGFVLWLGRKVQLTAASWSQLLRHWLLALGFVLVALGAVAATQYGELASFFRNYRDVKFLALPVSPLSAGISVAKQQIALQFPHEFQLLGVDVHNLRPTAAPRTLVLVLGETARADHFQLNGYPRATNPRLSQLPVVSFSAVSSCGTATAHSVPCMFSGMGREAYDEATAKNSSNVLDILQSSQVAVSWLDNNSGCKGVCDRLPSQLLFLDDACRLAGCDDAILLKALRDVLATPANSDRLIVLHQLGSHGPEYHKRSSPAQKVFSPECENKELNHCEPAQIVNAYDNSLLATDALLASVIDTLGQVPASAMLYISDHGESLGENGVYLHGMPYWMAPKAQTHVPLIWWMSQSFAAEQQLDFSCLQRQAQQPLSHDHLFHSLPALFDRASKVFKPELNLFAACRKG